MPTFRILGFILAAALLAAGARASSTPNTVASSDSTFTVAMAAGDSAFHAFDNVGARHHYAMAVVIDSTNFDALWKLSRAYTDCAAAVPKDEGEGLAAESERLARRCVALYPDSAQAHFTLALALGRMANLAGGKRRIELSREVKLEADSTLALNPRHFGAMHILGRWHYGIASLSWFERSIAKVIYGGIPEGASMEQARRYFEQAIELDPLTPINHLWLGETLIKLKDYPGARAALQRCTELDDVLWDDFRTKEKARERLEEIEGKT
jgi:tetratricopeptide (TPR) repeat protein